MLILEVDRHGRRIELLGNATAVPAEGAVSDAEGQRGGTDLVQIFRVVAIKDGRAESVPVLADAALQIPVCPILRRDLRNSDAGVGVVFMPVGGVQEQAGVDVLDVTAGLEEG